MSEQINTSAKRLLDLIQCLDKAHTQGELIYQHYFQAFKVNDIERAYELVLRSRQLVRQYEADISGLDDKDLYSTVITPLLNLFSLQQILSSTLSIHAA